MIEYDYGYWGFGHLFSLKGSVLPKTLVWSIPLAVASIAVRHIPGVIDLSNSDITSGWSAYSFILGTLMVFRINQAYSRYWESATLVHQLRGRWFNSISCLFAFCSTDLNQAREVIRFQCATARFMSMLYCAAVQQLSEQDKDQLEILDDEGMDEDSAVFLTQATDKCEVLMQWLQKSIVGAQQSGILTVPPPILAMTFGELGGGIVDLNNVRKVRDIPFPFPYAQMTMFLLLLHILMTPFVAAVMLKSPTLVGLSTFISITAYMGTYYITREIEQPFGNNENDLPLSEILRDMNESLCTLIKQQSHTPPKFNYEVGIGSSRSRKIDSDALKPTYSRKSRYSHHPARRHSCLTLGNSRPSDMELSLLEMEGHSSVVSVDLGCIGTGDASRASLAKTLRSTLPRDLTELRHMQDRTSQVRAGSSSSVTEVGGPGPCEPEPGRGPDVATDEGRAVVRFRISQAGNQTETSAPEDQDVMAQTADRICAARSSPE